MKKYYYPNNLGTESPKLGLLKTPDKQPYDVFYGEWGGIKDQLQGQNISMNNVTCAPAVKTIETLKLRYKKSQATHIKIYYADEKRIKKIYFQQLINATVDTYGRNDLHLAAKDGNLEKIAAILREEPTLIDTQDNKGYTPLHYAISYGHELAVKRLLDYHANIDIGAKVTQSANSNIKPAEVLDTAEIGQPKLLNEKALEPRVKQNISELFPVARHANVTIHFKKDSDGLYRIIERVDIIRTNLTIPGEVNTWYPLASRHPDDQCRHRVAIDWLAEQFEKNLIERDYREAAVELINAFKEETGRDDFQQISTTKSFADLVSHWFTALAQTSNPRRQKDHHNLFYGNKLPNESKGWLLTQLKNNFDETRFLVRIPESYEAWFKSGDCGCHLAHFVKIKNDQCFIEAESWIGILTLWQLSVIDDENFSIDEDPFLSPTSSHIADLICRFGHFNAQRLNHVTKSFSAEQPRTITPNKKHPREEDRAFGYRETKRTAMAS